MYARGMSTREITGHLEEIYGVEVSPALISNVTEAVMEEVKTWQGRPLDAVYPIVYLDALYVKIREAGHVRNRAIYVAIGVNLKGNKEVLGLWTARRRGQVLAAGAYGFEEPRGGGYLHRLRGWTERISECDRDGVSESAGAVMHRAPGAGSLNYVSWKQRKAVAADLQTIYRASTAEEAEFRLEEFAEKWDGAYPTISQMWRRNWEPDTVFRLSGGDSQGDLHDQCDGIGEHVAAQSDQDAGIVSECGGSDEAVVSGAGAYCKKWTMPVQNWKAALQRFAILLGDRVPQDALA